jgi:hypothetical protein
LQTIEHDVPLQVAPPFAGAKQATPQAVPQLLRSELLSHDPLHACSPAGQAQAPDWHVMPPVHAFPQDPQFALSVCSLTQVFVHRVFPGLHPHELQAQLALHVWDPLPSQLRVAFGAHAP